MKVLGVIPARGGSKRIPRKNIVDVLGKPLIAYTIETALKSNLIDRLIVSTDDEEIAEISKKFGAEVPFLRPGNLAKDKTPDSPVFDHAISELYSQGRYVPDLIVNLRPTSPLRTVDTINDAIKSFDDESFELLRTLSIVTGIHHPYWMYTMDQMGMVKQFNEHIDIKSFYQSQLLPTVYRINGAVDIYRVRNLKIGSILEGKIKGFPISDEEALDIDTSFDMKILKSLLKFNSMNEPC